jgi:hypothetical protein
METDIDIFETLVMKGLLDGGFPYREDETYHQIWQRVLATRYAMAERANK